MHVPAGAVPKDGPSAGVTMVTALVSMATGRQVRSDVGMTGEVTLNGRVLPIGGVKQKLLAAQRAGLSTVFIPQRNEPDLDDVPAEVLEALEVKPMTDVADIIAQALEPGSRGGHEIAGLSCRRPGLPSYAWRTTKTWLTASANSSPPRRASKRSGCSAAWRS